ncbi:mCG145478, partial [Mus musculus]
DGECCVCFPAAEYCIFFFWYVLFLCNQLCGFFSPSRLTRESTCHILLKVPLIFLLQLHQVYGLPWGEVTFLWS